MYIIIYSQMYHCYFCNDTPTISLQPSEKNIFAIFKLFFFGLPAFLLRYYYAQIENVHRNRWLEKHFMIVKLLLNSLAVSGANNWNNQSMAKM